MGILLLWLSTLPVPFNVGPLLNHWLIGTDLPLGGFNCPLLFNSDLLVVLLVGKMVVKVAVSVCPCVCVLCSLGPMDAFCVEFR